MFAVLWIAKLVVTLAAGVLTGIGFDRVVARLTTSTES
jgi:hypothetical protein